MLDDATRRQLRFSLFLQGFAILMLGGAAIVRIGALGPDVLSGLFLVGVAVVIAAFVWTLRRLRAG